MADGVIRLTPDSQRDDGGDGQEHDDSDDDQQHDTHLSGGKGLVGGGREA